MYSFTSSANSKNFTSSTSEMSLTKRSKKKGPRSEPCGTPEAAFKGYDKAKECLKTKVWLNKYDSIKQIRGPVIPLSSKYKLCFLEVKTFSTVTFDDG